MQWNFFCVMSTARPFNSHGTFILWARHFYAIPGGIWSFEISDMRSLDKPCLFLSLVLNLPGKILPWVWKLLSDEHNKRQWSEILIDSSSNFQVVVDAKINENIFANFHLTVKCYLGNLLPHVRKCCLSIYSCHMAKDFPILLLFLAFFFKFFLTLYIGF